MVTPWWPYNQMRSKHYPYKVNVIRKSVNQLRESSQLFPDRAVNQIRTGRQVSSFQVSSFQQ